MAGLVFGFAQERLVDEFGVDGRHTLEVVVVRTLLVKRFPVGVGFDFELGIFEYLDDDVLLVLILLGEVFKLVFKQVARRRAALTEHVSVSLVVLDGGHEVLPQRLGVDVVPNHRLLEQLVECVPVLPLRPVCLLAFLLVGLSVVGGHPIAPGEECVDLVEPLEVTVVLHQLNHVAPAGVGRQGGVQGEFRLHLFHVFLPLCSSLLPLGALVLLHEILECVIPLVLLGVAPPIGLEIHLGEVPVSVGSLGLRPFLDLLQQRHARLFSFLPLELLGPLLRLAEVLGEHLPLLTGRQLGKLLPNPFVVLQQLRRLLPFPSVRHTLGGEQLHERLPGLLGVSVYHQPLIVALLLLLGRLLRCRWCDHDDIAPVVVPLLLCDAVDRR
mmetsp:Transcript_18371/g.44229  ORF Transcript_18371/g.44229 Transcript_18371/m.44229 type:complete len:383 (+) Transcript_18371:350-1498(+)